MNDVYLNSFIEIPSSTSETTKLISHIQRCHHQIYVSKRLRQEVRLIFVIRSLLITLSFTDMCQKELSKNACAFSKCYSLSSTRLPMITVYF